jgi:hypothetical protein
MALEDGTWESDVTLSGGAKLLDSTSKRPASRKGAVVFPGDLLGLRNDALGNAERLRRQFRVRRSSPCGISSDLAHED